MSRRATKSRRNSYLLGAGLALAAATTISIVSFGGDKKPSAAPAPLTTTPSGPAPGSIHFPARFAGYDRLVGSQAAELENGLKDVWSLKTPFVDAAYGLIDGDPARSVLAGNVTFSQADISTQVNFYVNRLRSEDAKWVLQAQPTGVYGGKMVCGTIPDGTPGSLCIFADSTTFGITFAQGTGTASIRLAEQLRNTIETPPTK